jgi:TPR repeat protein
MVAALWIALGGSVIYLLTKHFRRQADLRESEEAERRELRKRQRAEDYNARRRQQTVERRLAKEQSRLDDLRRRLVEAEAVELGKVGKSIDYRLAFSIRLELATKHEMIEAQRLVARAYLIGKAVRRDHVEAMAWLYRIGSYLNEDDTRLLEELETRYGTESISQAQERAKRLF